MKDDKVTRSTLSKSLSDKFGYSQSQCRVIVDAFFAEIAKSLISGENVRISGLGNFVLRDKNERPARNLLTGELVSVTPRRVVSFKPGHKLKEKVRKSQDK